MRWAGHVARMGETRNRYRILVEKPEGKRPLGRPRRRWLNNIKIDLIEIGWGSMDWSFIIYIPVRQQILGYLIQGRLRQKAMYHQRERRQMQTKCWET
jgi:hypothetical protein